MIDAMCPLTSSNVLGASYDDETHLLIIHFERMDEHSESRTYHYTDVDPFVWEAFKESKHKGSFVNVIIAKQYHGVQQDVAPVQQMTKERLIQEMELSLVKYVGKTDKEGK